MKKYIDGNYVEMTAKEIENLSKREVYEPTLLERIEAIEALLKEVTP